MTRIEELPSGKRVLYIDIGNMSLEEADAYIKHISEKNRPHNMHYVIPTRSTKNSNKFIDLEFKMIMVIVGINFIGLLIQIMRGTS